MIPQTGRLAVYDAPNQPFEIRRFPGARADVKAELAAVRAKLAELGKK